MAKKIWDEKIGIGTDWGGDKSTNNLPVSGNRVQELIKEQLQGKAGEFYYDSTANRYLVFASKDTRDEYLNDTSLVQLILGAFDAPFNYSAEIKLTTPSYNSILLGTKNNYIDFTFDILNKQGQSIGENVICTFTFTKGSNKVVKTLQYKYGEVVHYNVDDYLSEGINNINISIVGVTTLAATSANVTYQVISLKLTDTYNVAQAVIVDTNKANTVAIPYSISGTGTKTLEWYLDGVLLPFNRLEDEVVEVSTNRTKYINVDNLSHGTHSIQYRAYVVINGEKFHTNTLYRDVLVALDTINAPIIGITTEFPFSKGIHAIDKPLVVYNVVQYIPYTLNFGVYRRVLGSNIPVKVTIGTTNPVELVASNNLEMNYTFTPTTFGSLPVVIETEGKVYEFTIDVEKTATSLEEITYGLDLYLTAIGKSNTAIDKDKWTYNDYKTTFKDFNWTSTSGWDNGSLIFRDKASMEINVQALTQNSVITGKTLEMEFSTSNVLHEEAIVCNLMEGKSGLLITASSITLTSMSGKQVTTKYKSGENIRVALVINPISGTVNKGLAFIYINGICTGAINYTENDRFISSPTFKMGGTSDVSIELKSLRFYNNALSHDQVLNNYMIYRESVEELLALYDKNNIIEPGGTTFSVDILARQAPVVIVTGDVPALENTSDKGLTIYVDTQYINAQDPTKSFTSKGTRMRPQGTSSMGYPKKNFRIYTKYGEMFDYLGNQIEKGKYSFKDKAQPVSTWCFKADYAESSGTHNTGVARLWNDVMYNTQIDGEYALRTEAQKAALANNFDYDVRTAVDGFPCHMFYKLTPDSELIYIGKYNFNNDKSTESVYGFTDIPGFDNSRMQCLELLNNGNHLALFQDTINIDTEWDKAYEFRYPEERTDISDLKEVSEWVVSTRHAKETVYGPSIRIRAELKPEKNGTYPDNAKNRQLKFEMEKWDYLDVPKVAAYYIFLMRFGGVDQVIKNAMFTTEGTQGKGTKAKWFFINYDNDTVLGLRNDGPLIYDYTIDRQTIDTSFEALVYAYAGHESTLWNNLEEDKEFMDMVSKVDNALYIGGLSYANVSKMFNIDQSSKWCERVYNQDAQYKYIGPYTDNGINNLYMLQGSRVSHRQWWLSNRFELLDSKFVSGAYKANAIELKLANAPIGLPFTITAGKKTNYGYGLNNVPVETHIELDTNDKHTFNTHQVINVGDPVRIYSAPTLKGIDISEFIEYMSVLNIERTFSATTGTYFEELIIGVDVTKSSKRNSSMSAISGLDKAERLTKIDISGFKGIKSLDLSNQTYLETFKAKESGLTAPIIAKGCPLSLLELPNTVQSLVLQDLTKLSYSGLKLDEVKDIHTIQIIGCPLLTSDDQLRFIQKWMADKTTVNAQSTLILDGILWTAKVTDLLELGKISQDGGVLDLKGTVTVKEDVTQEDVDSLISVFGEECFNPLNQFYIRTPPALFLIGPTIVLEDSVTQYNAIAVGQGEGTYVFSGNDTSGITITEDGLLTTNERGIPSRTFIMNVKFLSEDISKPIVQKNFSIEVKSRIYINKVVIEGKTIIGNKTEEYTATLSPNNFNGKFKGEWSLTGEAVDEGYIELSAVDGLKCTVSSKKESTGDIKEANLVYKVTNSNGSIVSNTKVVQKIIEGVLLTSKSHPGQVEALYKAGLCRNSNYILLAEVQAITELPSKIFGDEPTSDFTEFKEFTGLTSLPHSCFLSYGNSTYNYKLTLPPNIKVLENAALYNVSYTVTNLEEMVTKLEVVKQESLALFSDYPDKNIVFDFKSIKEFDEYTFGSKFRGLNTLKINLYNIQYSQYPNIRSVGNLENLIFYGGAEKEITFGSDRTFRSLEALKVFDFGDTIVKMDNLSATNIFNNTKGLEKVIMPKTVNYIRDTLFSTSADNAEFVTRENSNIFMGEGDNIVFGYIKSEEDKLIELSPQTNTRWEYSKLTLKTPDKYNEYSVNIVSTNKRALNYTELVLGDNIVKMGYMNFPKLTSDIVLGPNLKSVKDSINVASKSIKILGIEGTVHIQNCPNLDYLYFNKGVSNPILSGLSKLESIDIEEGSELIKTQYNTYYFTDSSHGENLFFVPYSLKKLILKDEESFMSYAIKAYANLPAHSGIEELVLSTNPNLNLSNWTISSENIFTNLTKLIIPLDKAPLVSQSDYVFGLINKSDSQVGSRVPEGTPKVLYVPVGATGYDEGPWKTKLLNPDVCNFTISYTL